MGGGLGSWGCITALAVCRSGSRPLLLSAGGVLGGKYIIIYIHIPWVNSRPPPEGMGTGKEWVKGGSGAEGAEGKGREWVEGGREVCSLSPRFLVNARHYSNTPPPLLALPTRVAAPSPRASLGRRTVCGRTEQLSAAGFEALRN